MLRCKSPSYPTSSPAPYYEDHGRTNPGFKHAKRRHCTPNAHTHWRRGPRGLTDRWGAPGPGSEREKRRPLLPRVSKAPLLSLTVQALGSLGLVPAARGTNTHSYYRVTKGGGPRTGLMSSSKSHRIRHRWDTKKSNVGYRAARGKTS